MRTTYGSTIYADNVPDVDALLVERLRDAGAIIVGKTNTPEFGAGANTFNDVFGATRNPWDPALTCGGSSGGSAVALAAGMSPLCEGSDLGGSLRTPASFCGVVGFRTTAGLVPSWPDSLPFDGLAVTGPMSRSVADCALMLSVIAGPDDRDPLSYDVDTSAYAAAVRDPSVDGWRVAFTPDLGGLLPVDPEVAAICEDAARTLGRLGARSRGGEPRLRRPAGHRARHARPVDGRVPRRPHPRPRRRAAGRAARQHRAGTGADVAGHRRRAPPPVGPVGAGAGVHGRPRAAVPPHRSRRPVPGRAALPDADRRPDDGELHALAVAHATRSRSPGCR